MSLKNWKELPIGGVIEEPGNSEQYNTGSWRTYRPVWDFNKCIQCLQCWIYCPDSCIIVENEKVEGCNLYHCKGCGICANECPPKVKAITMFEEVEFHKDENP
ncbi:MAG: hypothetical protein A3C43_01910 [Candidatus Schekmanbacteria bacterium RIFCSPHIGHO2_02_FULL_38_11]|uniref:4Fe-4S ferredoxin-type domain-containing protein n=1 Tax=Candidatus Schekmanbacteria bacterium RIFCSPLOWO2_12_FULL_38_15 TaxID=1817883 RepID=A0A1F7SNI5_9BACT|nr:MAG: hypothetical protein A2043_10555 [Candidatus Schekmanbacteria bacterium GWA2_38_9]OGL48845.1 MAG: hypothetical protein A3H37_11555 [Candidatus Schekmanbacteria bacterium RIFCSPLOWO2_02_FULL_38_14]OGL48879.1 MAG: hypothetical protein A3C43_01910 [Candidatus Schekmanbacteria bacterium RIFCSPHIGHO2_02_FULL_38_11]OGL55342.1 MAG: hypothetical protein A3G31_04890 [Candidatus Schekmanbacteria bacterium RIFCSPLOWO2_12_FULL_38_15]